MLLSDAAPFRRDEGRGVARKTFAPRRPWPEAEAHPLPVEVGDGRQPAQGWAVVRPGLAGAPARAELRQLAATPGPPRRFAPNQLRHAHAVELARESVAVNIIQLQVGHTDLGTASACLQGIDPSEIVDTVRFRRPPTMSATGGLAL
jgi:integrase